MVVTDKSWASFINAAKVGDRFGTLVTRSLHDVVNHPAPTCQRLSERAVVNFPPRPCSVMRPEAAATGLATRLAAALMVATSAVAPAATDSTRFRRVYLCQQRDVIAALRQHLVTIIVSADGYSILSAARSAPTASGSVPSSRDWRRMARTASTPSTTSTDTPNGSRLASSGRGHRED